jgi:hypothetical protein
MTKMTDNLEKLAELSQYLDTCPLASVRTRVVAQESARREQLLGQEHHYPLTELRWLYFKLRALEEAPLEKSLTYGVVAIHCEKIIADFVSQHSDKTNDKEELKELIKQQQELIFNKYLSDTILNDLRTYQRDADKSFSKEDILKRTLDRYQRDMYREALNQFETLCLIDRQYALQQKKEWESKDLVTGFMTINITIQPELIFIKTRLEQDSLYDFKLEGTSSLLFKFDELEEFTQEKITAVLKEFFKEKGEEGIDSRVAEYNIKSRSFNLYLNNPDYTTCLQHMSQTSIELDGFIQTVTLPKTLPPPVETRDKKLIALRKIVSDYQEVLDQIKEKETKSYKNRSTECLKMRSRLLDTLDMTLNRVDTLNEETRHMAHELVVEIKHNEPSWSELSFLDKLLDIITLGAHALYRHSIFKESKQETDLYNTVDPKNSHR